jgi:hypothetical protein
LCGEGRTHRNRRPRLLARSPANRHIRCIRRRGRVAEGGGLLNRYTLVKAYRGFESLRLRHPASRYTGCFSETQSYLRGARDIRITRRHPSVALIVCCAVRSGRSHTVMSEEAGCGGREPPRRGQGDSFSGPLTRLRDRRIRTISLVISMLYPRLLQQAEEGAEYLSTAPAPGQGFRGLSAA